MVGFARSLTDFCFCCYLSDLAVDKACQGQGIGKRLIEETRKAAGAELTTTRSALSPDGGYVLPSIKACRRRQLLSLPAHEMAKEPGKARRRRALEGRSSARKMHFAWPRRRLARHQGRPRLRAQCRSTHGDKAYFEESASRHYRAAQGGWSRDLVPPRM